MGCECGGGAYDDRVLYDIVETACAFSHDNDVDGYACSTLTVDPDPR